MSELNKNPQQFNLPMTDTGLDNIVPERIEAMRAELEQDRIAVGLAIESQFSSHPGLVELGENGAETLRLEMPWKGSGARRAETATITLSRITDSTGSTSTDLAFSSKHAWTSRARAVTVGDETRVQSLKRDDSGELIPSMGYERLDASTWRSNLEKAVAPTEPSRGFRRILGRRAIQG